VFMQSSPVIRWYTNGCGVYTSVAVNTRTIETRTLRPKVASVEAAAETRLNGTHHDKGDSVGRLLSADAKG